MLTFELSTQTATELVADALHLRVKETHRHQSIDAFLTLREEAVEAQRWTDQQFAEMTHPLNYDLEVTDRQGGLHVLFREPLSA